MLRPPEGLGEAGLCAWGRAMRQLERTDDPDLYYEAARRYASAADREEGARQAWYRAGKVLTLVGANGIEYPHPLLKVIRDAERDAAKYGEALGIVAKPKGRPGRNPVAVLDMPKRVTRRRVELSLSPPPSQSHS